MKEYRPGLYPKANFLDTYANVAGSTPNTLHTANLIDGAINGVYLGAGERLLSLPFPAQIFTVFITMIAEFAINPAIVAVAETFNENRLARRRGRQELGIEEREVVENIARVSYAEQQNPNHEVIPPENWEKLSTHDPRDKGLADMAGFSQYIRKAKDGTGVIEIDTARAPFDALPQGIQQEARASALTAYRIVKEPAICGVSVQDLQTDEEWIDAAAARVHASRDILAANFLRNRSRLVRSYHGLPDAAKERSRIYVRTALNFALGNASN